jgi:hypothetical protein
MAMEVRWHKENQVIYMALWGDITVDEIKESGVIIMDMVGADNPLPVHEIIDVSGMQSFPTQINRWTEVASSMSQTNKQSWFVVVGANRMVNFVGAVVSQLAGVNCKMVSSLAEAEEFVDHLLLLTPASVS